MPTRTRSAPRRLLGPITASIFTTLAVVASAATFPADPTWNALTQMGIGLGDPLADGQNNGREIVGDAMEPAVFIYADGTDFFVRLRVDTDPRQTANGPADNLRPYGWGLLIDTDGVLTDFEFSLLADGIGDHIELAENTVKTMVGDPSDKAETLIGMVMPLDETGPQHNVRVLPAGTAFNGDADFFLDFSIPLAMMTGAGINPGGPLVFWAGTSNDAQSISVDLANSMGSPGPGDLPGSGSDPVTIDGTPIGTTDTDMDGLTDAQEVAIGTDPNDADSDDDGVLDGQEPMVGVDSDGDGLINGLDPDSDDDGLFDGTELGFDCTNAFTDLTAMNCIEDGDAGMTTTDPLDEDTDDGGVSDGDEDLDKDGVVDADETDPNDGADDVSGMGGGGAGGQAVGGGGGQAVGGMGGGGSGGQPVGSGAGGLASGGASAVGGAGGDANALDAPGALGGCGCRVQASSTADQRAPWLLWALAIGLFARRRRRRSQRVERRR